MPLVLAGLLAGCQAKNTAIYKDPTKKTIWPPNYESFVAHTVAVAADNHRRYGCVGVGDSVDSHFNGTEASLTANLRQAMVSAHQEYFRTCQKPASPEKEPHLAVMVDIHNQQKSYLTVAGDDVLMASNIMLYRHGQFLQVSVIAGDGVKMVKAGGGQNTIVSTMTAEGCTPTIPDLSPLLIKGK